MARRHGGSARLAADDARAAGQKRGGAVRQPAKRGLCQAIGAIAADPRVRGIPTLTIRYRNCVERPAEVAAAVNIFLGSTLDEPAMAAAVDPSLYRHWRRRRRVKGRRAKSPCV